MRTDFLARWRRLQHLGAVYTLIGMPWGVLKSSFYLSGFARLPCHTVASVRRRPKLPWLLVITEIKVSKFRVLACNGWQFGRKLFVCLVLRVCVCVPACPPLHIFFGGHTIINNTRCVARWFVYTCFVPFARTHTHTHETSAHTKCATTTC